MKTKAFSREERKGMILTWFDTRVQKGNFDFATMNKIARGLNMSASSHLMSIIEEMVAVGMLTSRRVDKSGRWAGREFMLQPGTYELPRRRAINLKVNGRPEGQLELF